MKFKEMIEARDSLKNTVADLKKEYEENDKLIKEKSFDDIDTDVLKKATENKKAYESESNKLKELEKEIEVSKSYRDNLINSSRENTSEKEFNGANSGMEKNKNYLKSRESEKDFDTFVKSVRPGDNILKGWTDNLSKKGLIDNLNNTGLTLPEGLLPQNIATSYESNMSSTSVIVSKVLSNALINGTVQFVISDSSNVKGHKVGSDKTAGNLKLMLRELNGQYIYQIYTNPNTPSNRYNYSDIFKLAMAELSKSFTIGTEMAFTTTDLRDVSDQDKIDENKIMPIVKDFSDETMDEKGNGHFKMVTDVIKDNLIKDTDTPLMKVRKTISAVKNVSSPKDISLVISSSFYNELIGAVDKNNSPLLKTTDLVAELGINDYAVRDYFDKAKIDALALDPTAYRAVITTREPESYSFFKLTKNETDYLLEIGIAAALARPKGAAFLKQVEANGTETGNGK